MTPDRDGIPGYFVKSEYPFCLSPREAQVLQLAACGLTADLTARRLAISERTVRGYLSAARLKLRAENTVHAVAVALTHGLIAI